MKLRELKKEIKGVFKPPIKKYYFGKVTYGIPYFYPRSFLSTIIKVRKLKLRTEEGKNDLIKRYPHFKNEDKVKFSNLPMVRRNREWIKKIFRNYYFIQVGFPFCVHTTRVGWKDKWNSPRFEWLPMFSIYFFELQFCIFWTSPDKGKNPNKYYEMILWYLNYSDKNLEKAKTTWPWLDSETKKSTWNDNFLL